MFLLILPRNYLLVEDQAIGETIYIRALTLKKAGFLVFIKPSDDPKLSERILSTSDYLLPGVYADFNIDPYVYPIEGIFEPGTIEIVLYEDNGDNVFDPNLDTPAAGFRGKVYKRIITLR